MGQRGFLDSVDGGRLRGWAFDDRRPDSPARIEICINNAVVETIECAEFRQDLADAGIGSGRHGFNHPLPQTTGDLTVRFASGGPILHNGECALPGLGYRLLASTALAKGMWCIDKLEISAREISIEGWCVPPGGVPMPAAITHNGKLLEIERKRRDEIARMVGWAADEARYGFRARATLPEACAAHEFAFRHAVSGQIFDRLQTIHYLEAAAPLPPAELRRRVHGSEDGISFVREGSTAFVRLERVIEEYCSKPFTGFSRILDWGCGSGRVVRYLAEKGVTGVTGIDIDADAVGWCRQAFPAFEFAAVKPDPPTPFAGGTFDLVYGISVLTHLREADHLSWLEELQRIAKPGAMLLLSAFGDIGWWRGRLPWNQYSVWRADHHGFFDAGRNRDIDAAGIRDRDYYRNVFISHDYISRHWSKYFEVIDILAGAIGNLQDLVILRRK